MTKIGRNEPCPCGSGKKYKKCCLSKPRTYGEQRNPHYPHWDDVVRWKTVVNGKTMLVVRQIAVEIDRDTGEKFAEPYIAQLRIDGLTTKILTRTTKIKTCNWMCEQKRLTR